MLAYEYKGFEGNFVIFATPCGNIMLHNDIELIVLLFTIS